MEGAKVPSMQTDNTTRDEGNAIDWLISETAHDKMTVLELVDRKAPNGVYITPEMAEHVEEYFQYIDHTKNETEIEHELSWVHDSFRVDGRADASLYVYDEMHLRIDDMKYGHSVVEPHMNWTLISHAIGWVNLNEIVPQKITLSIFQPRARHVDGIYRSWTISYEELQALWGQIIARLSNPTDDLMSTPSVCYKCHARTTCPALQKSGYRALDVADKVFEQSLEGGDLAWELRELQDAEKTIKNRREALEELAVHQLSQAKPVPGYQNKPNYGNKAWKPDINYEMVEAMTGLILHKPKPLTPNQAQKAGVSPELIDSLSERPFRGHKLVRETAHQRASKAFK